MLDISCGFGVVLRLAWGSSMLNARTTAIDNWETACDTVDWMAVCWCAAHVCRLPSVCRLHYWCKIPQRR
jgi:hypothetical protein